MDLSQRLVLDPDATAEHQQLEGCHDEGWRPLSEHKGDHGDLERRDDVNGMPPMITFYCRMLS